MKEIIKQHKNMALLKIKSIESIGDNIYVGTRYEIWSDMDKMDKGIHTSEDGEFYCRGFCGHNEEMVIAIFDNIVRENEKGLR